MNDALRLSQELDRFVEVVDSLAAIAKRTDSERRHELILLRRRLADQIGAMREAGSTAFRDPMIANEFRSRLSSVLNVVSMHQANFPAISIDEGQERYQHSAVSAANGNRVFIEWARAELAKQR